MVPPQFTPAGASRDPNRSAGCTGPYPSSPTFSRFSEATPKGIPYPGSHCLAPTGSSLTEPSGYVLVFITVLWLLISHSLPLPQKQVKRISIYRRQLFSRRGLLFFGKCRIIRLPHAEPLHHLYHSGARIRYYHLEYVMRQNPFRWQDAAFSVLILAITSFLRRLQVKR